MNRVKLIREKKGLTQEQLAELSGVPQSTISRIENEVHKYGTSVENLRKISKALGVTVAELLEEDDEQATIA